jgi:hypothetical protein
VESATATSGGAGTVAGRLAPALRRGRIALTLVFFALGLLTASWAARIPAVKASLHLSAGALGVALLGPAVGLVASTVPTGALLARFRPRPVIAAGTWSPRRRARPGCSPCCWCGDSGAG